MWCPHFVSDFHYLLRTIVVVVVVIIVLMVIGGGGELTGTDSRPLQLPPLFRATVKGRANVGLCHLGEHAFVSVTCGKGAIVFAQPPPQPSTVHLHTL